MADGKFSKIKVQKSQPTVYKNVKKMPGYREFDHSVTFTIHCQSNCQFLVQLRLVPVVLSTSKPKGLKLKFLTVGSFLKNHRTTKLLAL